MFLLNPKESSHSCQTSIHSQTSASSFAKRPALAVVFVSGRRWLWRVAFIDGATVTEGRRCLENRAGWPQGQ
jgi:hypothetical protein